MVVVQVHFPVDQWGLTLVMEQVFALEVGLGWFSGKALELLMEGFVLVWGFQCCLRVYLMVWVCWPHILFLGEICYLKACV